jgi:cytochrome c556
MRRALIFAALFAVVTVPAVSGKKDKNQAEDKPAAAAPAPAPQAAPAAAGDEKLAALVDYRHNFYESMGKHMKLSSMIVQGKVDAPADMLLHAQALHGAAKSMGNLFPAGTGPDAFPKTEALATIWEDPAGFQAAIAAFDAESAKLLEVAQAGDLAGFKAQFPKVGATCGGCHDRFREDEG